MICDVVATLYITFFIRYISNDASILVWVGFSLNILSFILSFFVVESPIWLVSVGREQDAIKSLQYISKLNGQAVCEVTALREEKFETMDPEKDKNAAANVDEEGESSKMLGKGKEEPIMEIEDVDRCDSLDHCKDMMQEKK